MEHDGSAMLAIDSDRTGTLVIDLVVIAMTNEFDDLLVDIVAGAPAFGLDRALVYLQDPYLVLLGVIETTLERSRGKRFAPVSLQDFCY
jgi:hypothetical protein